MNTTFTLTTFGSMGWIPARDRQACCYVLEIENCDTLVVFDAGTGLSRFGEPWAKSILEKYDTVLMLLSHYHLDHVCGLMYLSHFFKGKKLHLVGPGKELYERDTKEILDSLIQPPFFGRSLDKWGMDVQVHDLGTGNYDIAGVQVETIRQEHSDPTLGYKINGSVCYLTDTAGGEESVAFVTGSRLLLHETWFDYEEEERLLAEARETGETPPILTRHSSLRAVTQLANQAGIETLVLIHLNPAYDETRFKSMETAAHQVFPNTRLARDGEKIRIQV